MSIHPGNKTAPATVADPAGSWRWIHIAVAALAMVATLPGRTIGLGLFTEPILHSLHFDHESYGFLNLWATLLGGLFCLPCGRLMDRFGTRGVLVGVMAALGIVVIAMSGVQGAPAWPITLSLPGGAALALVLPLDLFLLVLLTRGLGQSALSVASLTLVGRSAGRRTSVTMGVYAVLTAVGFVAAFGVLTAVLKARPKDDWRPVWAGIGIAVLVAAVVSGLLVRSRHLDTHTCYDMDDTGGPSHTLRQALALPAFWTFSLSSSFFLLVSSGTGLFNESVLAERGFDRDVFLHATLIGIPAGLAANLLCGWLATRWPLPRLLAASMAVLGLSLLAFPVVRTEGQIYAYSAALATAGGAITVCFFSVWRRGFGPAHLGAIQGAAQTMTVIFSALGPQLFGTVQARLHSYLPLFLWLGVIALILAGASWAAPLPHQR